MAQSALLSDLLPSQISFKHTLQIWSAYRHQNGAVDDEEALNTLCVLIAENYVGNRPGRAVKRRPKPYSLLMKPRNEAREAVKKHGHPRKQK